VKFLKSVLRRLTRFPVNGGTRHFHLGGGGYNRGGLVDGSLPVEQLVDTVYRFRLQKL